MLQPWQKGIVKNITWETENTIRMYIELPEQSVFDFKPGQFVTFDLPIHERSNKRLRSYSIASNPDGTNVIELVIVHAVPSTGGTDYIFSEIKKGSEITLRGPQGVFVLPDDISTLDIFFICTGTGIAPFRSMVKDILLHNKLYKNLQIVFGSRTQKDLLYYNEFLDISKQHNHIQYHPTLSREKWDGYTGYVHDTYKDILQKTDTPKEQHLFLLCGWKNMVDEARAQLEQLGYTKHNIHYELYG
jgi:glycine betaine catabolism B